MERENRRIVIFLCLIFKQFSSRRQNAKLLLALFDDLEEILASSEDFLLGKWLKMAKDLATDDEEEILYEYNARNQITLWGPLGEIRDYANKQWSGIVADYFKPRWAIFLNELETSLTTGTRVNTTRINKRIFENVEKAFTFSRKIYPTKATGDKSFFRSEFLDIIIGIYLKRNSNIKFCFLFCRWFDRYSWKNPIRMVRSTSSFP